MNPEQISPEQSQQIISWVGQRDSLLREIAVAKDELSKVQEMNRNLAESNTEIQNSINRSLGRKEELQNQEKENGLQISKVISGLLIEKSNLQSEVSNIKTELLILSEKKDELIKTIDTLSGIYEKSINFIELSTKTISELSHLNSDNIIETERLFDSMKLKIERVIESSDENYEKAQRVMIELPKIVFDLQRNILERKHLNKIKKV